MPTPVSVIGKYQIVERLGQGGMGVVYLAKDPALDRLVAVKVLRGELDDGLRDRFSREARSISRLRHPNIVTIFEYGEFKGQPFIAMEYISGESLAEMIQRRATLLLSRKLQFMEEVCAGMGYAHRSKIIHRDLKPANLMVAAEDNLIRILDFGIARSLEVDTAGYTQTIGTPSYMSPEQAAGERVDHRSDIFAVGAVFYELLSYRRAFDDESPLAIIEMIRRDDPVPLNQVLPGLDSAVISIVNKALEKDPGHRYQDLEAMRIQIASVRERITDSSGAARGVTPVGVRSTPLPLAQLAQRQAVEIRHHLDRANAAIGRREYEAAVEACEHVLLLDNTHALARALIDAARGAMDEARLQEHVRRARSFLNAGALTEAENAILEALQVQDRDEAALALQREIGEARQEREREDERAAAAEQALARARVYLADEAFEPAGRAASEALAHAPDLAEAREIKERALVAIRKGAGEQELARRAAEAVNVAERQFEAGQHQTAIMTLEQFRDPPPDMLAALDQLRTRAQAIEATRRAEQARQREDSGRLEQQRRSEAAPQATPQALATLVSEAERRTDHDDFDGALATIADLEQLDRTASDLPRLRETVLARRTAVEDAQPQRQDVEATLAAAATELEHGDLDAALEQAERAIELDPANAHARELRVRIQSAVENRQRQDELMRLARAAADEARRLFDAGDTAKAIESLEQFTPPHGVVTTALADLRERKKAIDFAERQRVRAIDQAIKVGRGQIARHDLDGARQTLERALAIDPRSAEALQFQQAIEEALPAPQAPQSDSRTPRARSWPARLAIVLATAILVVLIGSRIMKRREVAPSMTTKSSDSGTAVRLGTVILDAVPWAEVVKVVDAQGATQPIPPDSYTPLAVSLAPGDYDVTFKNGTSRTVRIHVESSVLNRPDPLDLGAIQAEEYFRRQGWR